MPTTRGPTVYANPWALATLYAVVIPVTMVRGYDPVKVPDFEDLPGLSRRVSGSFHSE